MEEVINSLSRKEDLIYTITCLNTTTGATSTECEDFDIVENEVTEENELILPSVMSVIATDTLDEGETHTYTIIVEYKNLTDVDQSEDMGKAFKAKVNIYDGKTKFLTTEIMKNAKSTSSADYNKTLYIDPSLQNGDSNSIPSKHLSWNTERVLSYSFDNDGTSFYYRGNVEDNYVTFANMCWRIVRIQGDGSIKLILEDKDDVCKETTEANWEIGSGNPGYSVYEPGTFYASDGVTANDTQVWLYDYLNGNTDYENSMAVAFQEFQSDLNDTINEMYNKNINQTLQSGGWCLGDIGYDEETGKQLTDTEKRDYIVDAEYIIYDSFYRNGHFDELNPTFKCNGTMLDKFSDNTTPMYVGTLTFDEIIYSGAVLEAINPNIYLINSYNKEQNENSNLNFMSLSYSYFESIDYIVYLRADGSFDLTELYQTNSSLSFRPSITLSKDTKIISGNGTSKKAYVVE